MSGRNISSEVLIRRLDYWPVVAGIYGLILLVFYGDLLFSSSEWVLSRAGGDIWGQFLSWRKLGFDELREGRLPMWNPYTYGGIPFYAGFQSALLYPLNLIYLILPVGRAMTLSIVLHLFLAGLAMYFWLSRGRNLSGMASFLGGLVFMFCGAHYLHIDAGHLSNLCVIPYIPLVLLSLDLLAKGDSQKGIFLGTGAVALQILAGHPQYVFFTGVIAGFYNLLLPAEKMISGRAIRLGQQALIYIGAAGLSAVQLIPGIEASAESARAGGMSWESARIFSFPPENVVTMIFPSFFGQVEGLSYFGRWLYWEMCVFVGVITVLMGCLAFVKKEVPSIRILLLAMISLILALGAYTPVYRVLYEIAPGMNLFRGQSKFILFFAIAWIWLAASGFDSWLKTRTGYPSGRIAGLTGGVAILFIVLGVAAVDGAGSDLMAQGLQWLAASGEILYVPAALPENPVAVALAICGKDMIRGGCFLMVAGVIIWWGRHYRASAAIALLFLLAVEMLMFSAAHRSSFALGRFDEVFPAEFRDADGKERVLFEPSANISAYYRTRDMWGNDPALLKRYAEFIAVSQKQPIEKAAQAIEFREIRKIYEMLGLRHIIYMNRVEQRLNAAELVDYAPRAYFPTGVRVIEDDKERLEYMLGPDFDFRKVAILEEALSDKYDRLEDFDPAFYSVQCEVVSTDELHLVVRAPADGLLVINENYSKGWRIRRHVGEEWEELPILPANHIHMAVPIEKGNYSLELKYRQPGLKAGLAVTVATALLLAGGWGMIRWKRK